MNDLYALLQSRFAALTPTHIELIDESHLHAGHAGSRQGGRHFRLHIASPQFAGLSRLAQQRLVLDQVKDLMPLPLHALAIRIQV